MDIQALTSVFMWMTIINGAILVTAAVSFSVMGDLAYASRSKIFPIEREAFNIATYASVSLYKILWVVFNIVPYVALLIVG